jgi:hypothetical protein
MATITFPSLDHVSYLRTTIAGHAGTATVDDHTVTLDQDALDTLAELPDDADGHYDGRDVWIGGTPYRPVTTATINVVTGELVIAEPATDADGIQHDRRELAPWGAEEYHLTRAAVAIRDLGYVVVGTWDQDGDTHSIAVVYAYAPDEQIPVGATDIAERTGIDRDTVEVWSRRYADFPPPRWTVAGRKAWAWADVVAWLRSSGRGWMLHRRNTDAEDLLRQLRGYTGDNPWQDVIAQHDAYDQDATAAADQGFASDVIVCVDGTVIRWDTQRGEWDVEQ